MLGEASLRMIARECRRLNAAARTVLHGTRVGPGMTRARSGEIAGAITAMGIRPQDAHLLRNKRLSCESWRQ